MRLIDADALKTLMVECIFSDRDRYSTGYAKSFIDSAPTVDAVPVRHGRWIDSEEDGHLSICGVCNYPVDRFYKTKYCPNCGAKMTEDRHEQKE